MDGDSIPVSTFLDTPTGLVPNGTAAFEKRGIATDIPVWNKDNCIQCNQCAYVCPHGVIRPFVIEGEAELAGTNGDYAEFKGGKDENKKYTMGISALDCTGCGSCAQTCPAPNTRSFQFHRRSTTTDSIMLHLRKFHSRRTQLRALSSSSHFSSSQELAQDAERLHMLS